MVLLSGKDTPVEGVRGGAAKVQDLGRKGFWRKRSVQVRDGRVKSIHTFFRFGTVLVSTVNFQKSLKDEVKQWINTITKAIHSR